MAAVTKINPYRKREEGVALFIDWENLKISLQTVLQAEPDVQALLTALDNYGQRGVSRAYADWQNYSHLHDDQTRLLMKSVETVQILGRNPDTQNPIKNSADVALAVEATRTCYHHPDLTTFVLVTGDGDLVHLVNELKRNRNRVVIVGVEGTISRLLRETADEVLYYERDIEPHLSKPNRQNDVVDVDTVLEGIKKTLRSNRSALKLSDIGRIMGSNGISLRSSNYGLSELSDILVKRGELERFEQDGVPYLRLNRGGRQGNGNNKRNNRSTASTDNVEAPSAAQDNQGIDNESVTDLPTGVWYNIDKAAQDKILGTIYALEERSPFVTFNYLLENLHQTLPEHKKDTLEVVINELIEEGILDKKRRGSGREARNILQLNADHAAVNVQDLASRHETTEVPELTESQPTESKSAESSNKATKLDSNVVQNDHTHDDIEDDTISETLIPTSSVATTVMPATSEQAQAGDLEQHDTPQPLLNNVEPQPSEEYDIISAHDLPETGEALWQLLQQAQAEKWVLEVIPTANEDGTLIVDLGDIRAVLPADQLELTRVDDASIYANKPIDVHVLSLEHDDDDEAHVLLSRRGVLARRMVEKDDRLRHELYVGRDVTCRVISITDYAAFVDLGGERGFIHNSEISDPEPSHPNTALSVGDVVVARVTLLDWSNERIQLSIKQATQYDNVAQSETTFDLKDEEKNINDATMLIPLDTSIEKTPVLEDTIDDLETENAITNENPVDESYKYEDVYASREEISRSKRNQTDRTSVQNLEAQDIQVQDTETIRKPLRWHDVKERYPEGRRITGEVNNVVDFGAFLTLEHGYSALLHKSELQRLEHWDADDRPQDVVAVGNHLDVVVKRHDSKRKHLILGLDIPEVANNLDEDPTTSNTQNVTDDISTNAISEKSYDTSQSLKSEASEVADSALDSHLDEAVDEIATSEKDVIQPLQGKTSQNTMVQRGAARGMKIRSDVPSDEPNMTDTASIISDSDLVSSLPEGSVSSEHITTEKTADSVVTNIELSGLEKQKIIIQHATDVISHQSATYVPLTQLYHHLEQEGVVLDPAVFKNALVRAHQGRKLRIVRHPENRTLYAGLGVQATDEIAEILL